MAPVWGFGFRAFWGLGVRLFGFMVGNLGEAASAAANP